ncbi:alpha/beta hydrolase [Pseudonocardia sp. RS010]|uniref:alpha/beta hydrolase n=1 Tax=Pseudonocardia sp. RS010 TaxID=3385979 RepID=UPI0039A06693
MARTVPVRLEGDRLVVAPTRGQRLAGLIRGVSVPLGAIGDVRVVPDARGALRGIRAPGLAVPRRTYIGTWRRRGHRELVIARAGAPALRIELTGSRYDAMLLGTADPDGLAARIRDRRTHAPQIVVDSDGERLAGTLRLPAARTGPVPAVLLLPGSGPLDRDSDHRRATLGVTRLLADALADAGVASLRVDKRGTGASTGDFFRTGFLDTTRDAEAALAALAARPEVDAQRIVVAGHSEGAFHAVALGAEHGELAGVVLLSGAAHPAEEVLRYQGRAVLGTLPGPVRALLRLARIDVTALQRKRITALRATTTDVTGHGPLRTNARWFREFLQADPRPQVERLAPLPVLAVTGERDVQVDPADAELIARLTGGEAYRAPGVTHLLRRTPDAGGPSTYRRQSAEPLAEDVVERVVGFVRRVTERPRAADEQG